MAANALKIAMVARELPPAPGGIAYLVADLSRALGRLGHNVTVVVSRDFNEHSETDARVVSVPVIGVEPIRAISFGGMSARFLKSARSEYDVIHLHYPSAVFTMPFLDSSASTVTVGTVHSTSSGSERKLHETLPAGQLSDKDRVIQPMVGWIQRAAEKEAYRRSDILAAVSRSVADEITEFYGQRGVSIVPNGVDSSRVLRDPVEEREARVPIALYVGHLRSQKGVLAAIEALRSVSVPFKLRIVGSGELLAHLNDLVPHLPFPAELHGLASGDELSRLYQEADVLLMPSYYEGMPIVGLEAAASGLPIAGFEASVAGEFVDPSNLPYIVNTGNTRLLSAALEQLLGDASARRDIGKRNQHRVVTEFSIDRTAQAYLKLYREVAE